MLRPHNVSFCLFVAHFFCLRIDASPVENKPLFKPGCTKPELSPRCIKGKRLAHKKTCRKPVQDVVLIIFCGERRKKKPAFSIVPPFKKTKQKPFTLSLFPSHNWYLPERHLENALGCRIINIRAVLPPRPSPSRVQFAFDSRWRRRKFMRCETGAGPPSDESGLHNDRERPPPRSVQTAQLCRRAGKSPPPTQPPSMRFAPDRQF